MFLREERQHRYEFSYIGKRSILSRSLPWAAEAPSTRLTIVGTDGSRGESARLIRQAPAHILADFDGPGPMIADSESRVMGTRVLIAEDHVDSATGIGRLLRLYGYDVTIATDGRDAVRAATRFAAASSAHRSHASGARWIRRRQAAARVDRDAHSCRLIAMTGWTA